MMNRWRAASAFRTALRAFTIELSARKRPAWSFSSDSLPASMSMASSTSSSLVSSGSRAAASRYRHAYTESESVQNMPTLRQARMLPVPATVAPTGVIFMGAHFKLAQSKRISPRLHYYNDVAKTGKVYVGYIGRHLPLAS